MDVSDYYDAVLPYYDASLANRGDLPFWDSIAKQWSVNRTLELGCGTGRVTKVLSRYARVTAVDLLIAMIRHAPKNAERVVADLRCFAFATSFDLIILADDPLSHVTSTSDRSRAMKLIREHLAPHGRVVLEGLFHPRDAAGEKWEACGDALWRVTYRYGEDDISTILRSWTRDDLDQMRESGLEIETIWGDFDRRPFDDQSPRIVIVAHDARTSIRPF